MFRIMTYDEMIEFLNSLDKNVIKEEKSIGYSTYGEPIRHYSYGHGSKHVILSAGKHACELITNVFVLLFMKKLCDKEIYIDENKYTVHFFPFENPEGTIIVTSAIRALIPKESNYLTEQLTCLEYYLNSIFDDISVNNFGEKEDMLSLMMFKHIDYRCIPDKYSKIKQSVQEIFDRNNLCYGVLSTWSSNANGVDLNANIECGEYLKRFLENGSNNPNSRLCNIDLFKQGPLGCPSRFKDKFVEEPENTALINYYKYLKENYDVIGSFIFHACGGIVYYLDKMNDINHWNEKYGIREIMYNRNVAKCYGKNTEYRLIKPTTYTTFCSKVRTLIPGSLVIELSRVRSNPLSQFIDLDLSDYIDENVKGGFSRLKKHFSHTIDINTKAVLNTIDIMDKEYDKYKYDVIVNKENELSKEYRCNFAKYSSKYSGEIILEEKTLEKILEFINYAGENNINLEIESAYRSYDKQKLIYEDALKENGLDYVNKYVAKPGYSEHQTGLAVDLAIFKNGDYLINDDFIKEKDICNFIKENCYKFGFILRYPFDKKKITGYNYEPWHLRYVGNELALYLKEKSLTLEDYYEEENNKDFSLDDNNEKITSH